MVTDDHKDLFDYLESIVLNFDGRRGNVINYSKVFIPQTYNTFGGQSIIPGGHFRLEIKLLNGGRFEYKIFNSITESSGDILNDFINSVDRNLNRLSNINGILNE